MAKPQHRTPEYRAAVKHWEGVIARQGATCAEAVCLMPSREIPQGAARSTWHVCHDTSGTVILGPGHWQCNLSEAGKRGHAKQMGRDATRWVL